MTVDSELLRRVAGLHPDAMREMLLVLAEQEEKAETKRAKARDKKRTQRGQERDKSGTCGGTNDRPPPSSSPPITPLITTPPRDKINKQNARARGERLPEGFEPSSVDLAVIRNELGAFASDWRLAAETEKFRDHWRSSSGANAAKRNWGAAWRNWMRNAAERSGSPNGHAPPMRENGALAAVRKQLREIEERDDRKPTFDFDQS